MWKRHFVVTDTLAFIQEPGTSPESVSKAIGIDPPNPVKCVVLDVSRSSVYGYNSRELWDWMKEASDND